MTDEPTPRAKGAARLRLEEFERASKKTGANMRKLIAVWLLLVVALAGYLTFASKADDYNWFDLPKETAAELRAGNFSALEGALADDFVARVRGGSALDRQSFLDLVRGYGDAGGAVFTSQPHAFSSDGDERRLAFWVLFSRGDLNLVETVPLVRSWYVDAVATKVADSWRFKSAVVRESLSPD